MATAPVFRRSAGDAERLHRAMRLGVEYFGLSEGIMYSNVTKADVDEIFDEHLLGGKQSNA